MRGIGSIDLIVEKEDLMKTCEKCKYAKFDERWGEWKCLKFARRIYNCQNCAALCTKYEELKKKPEKSDV